MEGLKVVSLEESLRSVGRTERRWLFTAAISCEFRARGLGKFSVGQWAGEAVLSGSLASQRSCVGAVHVAVVSEVEAGPVPHLLRCEGLPQ